MGTSISFPGSQGDRPDTTMDETGDTQLLGSQVKIGICAMDKKKNSKPMLAILNRLANFEFEIVPFPDSVLLESPIEEWPVCDALIAFFSTGFPLEKAEAYAELRRPYLLNDLALQRKLFDRREVYRILEEGGVPTPPHVFCNRDSGNEPVIEEHDDYIEIDGRRVNKPFVEKPVSGEDHNIYIYYPRSAGGGSKRLFRKIGNRSSEFYPEINSVRRDGSYIYEEFLRTEGTDVKVYTVKNKNKKQYCSLFFFGGGGISVLVLFNDKLELYFTLCDRFMIRKKGGEKKK